MASAARAQVKIIGQNAAPPVKVARATASGAKYEPAGDKVYHGASLPDAWSEKRFAPSNR